MRSWKKRSEQYFHIVQMGLTMNWFEGQEAVKKMKQAKKTLCNNPIYPFLTVHTLNNFHFRTHHLTGLPFHHKALLRSESKDFDWLTASHVTRLPIHTSQTWPMCQSTSAARDQLVRSGVFNQTPPQWLVCDTTVAGSGLGSVRRETPTRPRLI